MSKWKHSQKKDEYVLVRSQTLKKGVIYTTDYGEDVTGFVLLSLDKEAIECKTQTDAELQDEKSATHVEMLMPVLWL